MALTSRFLRREELQMFGYKYRGSLSMHLKLKNNLIGCDILVK
jgi:hypothetical protein